MTIHPQTDNSPTVLLVGAAGWLGQKITREISRAGGRARVGLRGGMNHPEAAVLCALPGVEAVELDVTQPDTLPAAVEGVSVVVSTLQGGPDLLIDGQVALARAAHAAGAQRIFPSDFAADFSQIPAADHLFFSWRSQAHEAIADIGLAQTNVYNGAFTEMLLPQAFFDFVDWDNNLLHTWGSPDQAYDFTTTDDVARYVAAATVDPQGPVGPFRIAGDSRSPQEIVDIATSVTGRAFAIEPMGSLEDLTADLERRKGEEPNNPMAWASLEYFRSMASGAGKLHSLHNDLYPQIDPTSIATFLTGHQPPTA